MVSKKQESGVKIVRNLTPFLPIIAFFYNFDPGKQKNREQRRDTHRAHPVCRHHADGFPDPDAGIHPAPARRGGTGVQSFTVVHGSGYCPIARAVSIAIHAAFPSDGRRARFISL